MKTNKKIFLSGLVGVLALGLSVGGVAAYTLGGAEESTNAAANENPFFLSKEKVTVTEVQADTRGVIGTKVVLEDVKGKDKVTLDYGNYFSADVLSQGFLEMSFMPQEVEKLDFDAVVVTVSDAFDEDKKLCYVVAPEPDSAGWWYTWTAAWVSYTDDLTLSAKAAYSFGAVCYVTGTSQNIYGYNNAFLNQWQPEYDGVTTYFAPGYNLGNKYSMFKKTEEYVVLNSLKFALSGSHAQINNNMIADLTNEQFMTRSNAGLVDTKYENLYTTENFENKFSSGYCKLSVSFLGCNSDKIECHFKQIGGQNIQYQEGQKVKNDTPYIEVQHNSNAVVGKGFKLPKAKILDMREGDISEKISYAFFDNAGERISYTDDSVQFSKAGDYTMTATVTLEGGETFEKEYSVKCFDSMPKTAFEADVSLGGTYQTGDKIAVPSVGATNLLSTRAGGSVDVMIYLQRNGANVAKFRNGLTDYFMLTEDGDYVLSYVFQNAYGVVDSLTYTFTVEQSIGLAPEFLPVSLTSNKANKLADCAVTNYVSDVATDKIYRAIYVNGEQVYLAQGDNVLAGSLTFTKDLKGLKDVELSYRAGFTQNELVYEKNYTIPVLAPVYADDYIIVQNEKSEYTSEGIEYLSTKEEVVFKTSQPHTFTLPQALSLEKFELVFDVKAAYMGTEELSLRLRDFYDPTKSVVFTVEKNSAAKSYLYMNGAYQAEISGSFINDSAYFDWLYDTQYNYLTDSLGVPLTKRIATWEDGRTFDGFTDNIAVLSVELKELKGEAAFSIKKVNNQSLFTTELLGNKQAFMDTAAPNIKLFGTIDEKAFTLGARIMLPAAKAYDVLSPTSSVTLTVIAPDGTYVADKADISEEYLLVVNQLGKWTISYVAYDSGELFSSEEKYVIDVKDSVAPKLYINGTVPSTVKVGDTVTFPSAEVFDNVTKNCKVHVIVVAPDSFRQEVKDDKYTFTEKGRYLVKYYTYDEYMNVTQYVFEIQVA